MNLRRVFGLTLIVTTALAASSLAAVRDKTAAAGTPAHTSQPEYAPGMLLVKFRTDPATLAAFAVQSGRPAGNRAEALAAFHAAFGTRPQGREVLGWQRVELPAGHSVAAGRRTLAASALVESVEPNYRAVAFDLSTTYTAFAIPSEPMYQDGKSLWYLNRTRADQAMNAGYSFQGTEVVVAVADTGLQANHPDLAGRTITGYSAVTYTTSTADDNTWIGTELRLGHGTHCAGLIAANGNNGSGIAGTAYRSGVRVMPIKVLDGDASGWVADIADGITWASDHGAKVINLSLGTSTPSTPLLTACNHATSQGCLLVVAAGNDTDVANPSLGNLSVYAKYPANYSKTNNAIITVAATASDDYETFYTNYCNNGDGIITVAAPGGSYWDYSVLGYPWTVGYERDYGVTSTAMSSLYTALDGTSFAAPQVAALAGLLWLQVPSRTAPEIRNWIMATAEKVHNRSTGIIGSGRINVAEALAPTRTTTPTASPTFTRTRTATPTATRTITRTATSSATYTMTPTVTVTPTVTPTPSVTPTSTVSPTFTPVQLASGELRVYPQPAKGRLHVLYAFAAPGRAVIALYNPAGERALRLEEVPVVTHGTAASELATGALAPGVYILRAEITDADGTRTLRRRIAIVH